MRRPLSSVTWPATTRDRSTTVSGVVFIACTRSTTALVSPAAASTEFSCARAPRIAARMSSTEACAAAMPATAAAPPASLARSADARPGDSEAESAALRLTVTASPAAPLEPKSITFGAPGDAGSPDKSETPSNVVAPATRSMSSRRPENSEFSSARSFAEISAAGEDDPSARVTGVNAAACASVSIRASFDSICERPESAISSTVAPADALAASCRNSDNWVANCAPAATATRSDRTVTPSKSTDLAGFPPVCCASATIPSASVVRCCTAVATGDDAFSISAITSSFIQSGSKRTRQSFLLSANIAAPS